MDLYPNITEEILIEVDGVSVNQGDERLVAESLLSLIDGIQTENHEEHVESNIEKSESDNVTYLEFDMSDGDMDIQHELKQRSPATDDSDSEVFMNIGTDEYEESSVSPQESDSDHEYEENTDHQVQNPQIPILKGKRKEKIKNTKKRSFGREINEYNREHGLAYSSVVKNDGKAHGVKRPARKIGPECTSSQCTKKKSCQSFSQAQRLSIFKEFWGLNSGQKKIFLRSMVDSKPTKPPRKILAKHREQQNSYHLKSNGVRKVVCLKFFLSTLGIGPRQLQSWLDPKKDRERPERMKPLSDGRKEAAQLFFKQKLAALPKVPSHFCRASSDKEYLQSEFKSIRHVHRILKAEARAAGIDVIEWSTFHGLFTSMNLAVHQLRKDACDDCTSLRLKLNQKDLSPEEKEETELKLEKHRSSAKRTKEEKDKDKRSGPDTLACVSDLQKIFNLPMLNINLQYYLCKLQVRNWTTYNLKNKDAHNQLWDETQGGVDASDFTTVWIMFLSELFMKNPEAKKVTAWSDGCCAQNRNTVLSNALLLLAIQLQVTIIQKFFLRGHSFNEGDSMHSTIERAFENELVYSMDGFVKLIEAARLQTESTSTAEVHPYTVKLLEYTDFKDYKNVTFYKSIRPGVGVGSATVNNLRAIRYLPNGTIQYKLDFDEPWQEMPNRVGSPTTLVTPKYTSRIPITKQKFDHLQKLKPFMPIEFHQYFDDLPHKS